MQKKRTKFQIRSDAAKQRWVRDDKKETFWRRHLEEWKVSGLSKRAYCIQQNLPQSSFNAWRRELDLRDREKGSFESSPGASQNHAAGFVPIRLVPDNQFQEHESEPRIERLNASEKKGVVEVVIPGGAVLRIDEHCPEGFVSKIFSALKMLGKESS